MFGTKLTVSTSKLRTNKLFFLCSFYLCRLGKAFKLALQTAGTTVSVRNKRWREGGKGLTDICQSA